MTSDIRLIRLTEIADLLRDHALRDLRVASDARTRLRHTLDGMAAPSAVVPPEPADWANAVRHEAWADLRRVEINLLLARQTAAWIEARARAAQATGRAQALRRLIDR